MTTTTSLKTLASLKRLIKGFCGALFFSLWVVNAHGAPTSLATEPFALSTKINALPNIMFVLDDSGSMKADFLPDWAGPYQATISSVLTTVTPAHRFFNGAYNGVAYNPATRYRPPVMYSSAGALDTTTYPSMTGQSVATGGDASATTGVPNWRSVKVDGFGVQSAAKVNLEGYAFSYTTVAGEYCDSVQLRNCVASATPTGVYTFPAKLRWCGDTTVSGVVTATAAQNAIATTASAGTHCQASNIANTPTNIANGVTPYTEARMPRPRTSTITVSAPGTVTNITVDGFRIIPADATGGSDVSLAADIAAKINACTYGITGVTPCAVVGYSAVSLNTVVTITAPGPTTSTPVVTGGSTTPTAFSGVNVPGSSLFTVITPSVTSYPYPGLAAKDTNRTDCAGTTCTYEEEMTNYANWYAYYRTRMQMMKTASSIAFSAVDDKFRVGYYTINNGAGNQFLNTSAFDGAQKYLWYSKFMSAVPFGATPLRTGLATIGQMYAGQLNSSALNGVGVTDPMQYSCQQNFTILSTDGYWNDAVTPKRIDGATDIGQQDGSLDRPFYDGGTQTRTVSQTLKSEEQVGINRILVENMTRQQQTSTTPLTQSTYNLISKTYQLKSDVQQLLERTFNLESTPQLLQSTTYKLTKVSTPLQQTVTNITQTVSPLQSTTTLVNSTTAPLQSTTTKVTSTPYALQSTTTLVNSTTAPLQSTTALLNSTTAPLQSTTTKVTSTPYALQSTTTKVTSVTSPLQSITTKVTSTPYALQSTTTKVTSVTAPLQSTTTKVTSVTSPLQSTTTLVNSTTSPLQSTTTLINSTTSPLQSTTSLINSSKYALLSSTYKLQTSTRQLQTMSEVSTDGGDTWQSTGWVDSATCTVRTTGPGYTRNTQCRYNSAVDLGGQNSCQTVAASTAPNYTVAQAVTCSYDTLPTVASVGSCTVIAQPNFVVDHYAPSVSCGYSAVVTFTSGLSSCTAKDQTGSSTMTGDKVVCAYDSPSAPVAVASCTPTSTNTAASPQITCGYGTAAPKVTGLSACTANNQATNAAMTGDKVVCAYDSPSAPVAVASCTATTSSTGALPIITCAYGTAGTPATGLATCTAKDQTGSATMTGDKVVCGWDSASPAVAVGSCTPTASPTTAAKKITCGYGAAGAMAYGLDTCVANSQATTGAMTGDKVVCGWDSASPAVAVGSCTPTASPTTAAKKITCGYGTAGAMVYGLDTCAANSQSTSSAMTGDQVVCGWDAALAPVAVSSCTPTASPTTAAKKITCGYSTAAGTTSTGLDTCVANNQATTAAMTGDKIVCGWDSPLAAVNVGSCTPTASPTTAAKKITCGYGTAGAMVYGLDTCAANSQSTSSAMTGDQVVCGWDSALAPVAVSSCTPTASPTTAAKKITCGYSGTAGTTTLGLDSCVAVNQPTNAAMSGDKIVCGWDSPLAAVNVGSCTPTASPTTAAKKITCGYGTPGATVHNLNSCTANNQATSGAMTGDQVICGYDPASAPVNVGTCTPAAATGSAPAVTCGYGAPGATVHNLNTCTANSQPTTGTMTGNQVVCGWDSPSAAVNVGSCTPTASPTTAAKKITCDYSTTAGTTTTGLDTCVAFSQATTGAMSGDKIVCGWDSPLAAVNVGSCTPTASPTTAAKKITCGYGTPGSTLHNLSTCTANNQSTSGAMTGDQVVCAFDSPSAPVDVGSCTPTASPTTAASKITCGYGTAGTPSPGQTSCTAKNQPTNAAMTGDKVVCAYDTSSTTTTETSCTATSPNTAALPRTTCAYGTADAPQTDQTTCNRVDQSAGPSYVGPAVTCAYQSPAIASNQAACTAGTASAGPAFSSYSTCAYVAGTTTTGLNSCSYVAKTGPVNFTGPANDCAYSTASVDVVQTSCTPVAASGTFSAPAKACGYDTVITTSTGLGSCTNVAQSTVAPFVGPSVSCYYDTAASATNLNASTCTANRQTASPYTGPAVDCTYSTTPVVVSNVGSCTAVTQSAGPVNYSGPAVSCANDASAIVTVDTPTCTPVAAGVPPAYNPIVTCPVTNPGMTYVPVAPSCTPSGSLPSTFDATGKIVLCRTTDTTPYSAAYPSGPVPVASCTPGATVTDPTTKEQTTCTLMLSTGPTPVDPTKCTTAAPIAANSYVKTSCPITTSSSTVMGCSAQTAAPLLWQTVTCVDNAGTGTINSLADVAAYYYYTDLRTPALGNCTGSAVAPATTGSSLCSATDAMNNVPTTTKDPLNTQHMTTFTLGLGASGYMKYSDTYLADTTGDYASVYGTGAHTAAEGIAANPSTGVCSWQSTGNCNWPYPASDEQTTIDDLWHAGVNGHGAYFSATDPKSLSTSISSALSGVAAAGGASASPTISNPSLSPADNYIFSSTYTTSDWTGELLRRQLDPYTGAVTTTVDWAAQAKLDAKSAASRTIYAFDSSVSSTNKLKLFTSANFAANTSFLTPHISTSPTGLTQFLCSSADTCLTAADQALAAGANLVNFIRGDRTNEGTTDNSKYYRQRPHVLGDMVNAQAVYVSQPLYTYADTGYSAYKTSSAIVNRQAVVYAAANDGMLHAFAAKGNATTEAAVKASADASSASYLDPSNTTLAAAATAALAAANTAVAADTTIGQELWAYIPTMVIPNLYKLADKKYKDEHRYYVDATPVVGDVCVSNCVTAVASDWRTIMVGGLGRGGRGYYALDITDPANPKALWEFTDTNLGYSFGNPQIAKRACSVSDTACKNAPWVVIFTSGYNNIPNEDGAGGDGVGRLYVLNAETGVQLSGGASPISTGVGSVSDPSGLARITAQVLNPVSDNTVEAVYGGDLYGNLWRFDINDTVGASGYDAQLLAVLKDGSGNLQPITTKPEVGLIPKVGVKVVYVGTGRFLAASDASDVSQQSFYAIKDVRATGTTPATAIYTNPGDSPRSGITSSAGFVRQVQTEIDCPAAAAALFICDLGTKVRTSTANSVDFSSDNGWFVDFVGTSERANTDPALALGLVALNTNAPTLAACDVGGKSYQYSLDYLTGGPIKSPGNYNAATNTGYASKFLANELASGATLVVTKSGKLLNITGLSGGTINVGQPPLPAPASISRRTSWRELIRE